MPTPSLTNYLTNYAEAEARELTWLPEPHRYVLVIPAYQEDLAELENVFKQLSDVIVVLVVNTPNAEDAKTKKLLSSIAAQWRKLNQAEGFAWYQTPSGQTALVVDRVTRPIAPAKGVGLARKIGTDMALALIEQGVILVPWIFASDADAVLPSNYFSAFTDTLAQDTLTRDTLARAPSSKQEAFRVFPFQHQSDLAAALYEFSLLWYPLGLSFAGSPYAFPTIGSCLACHASAYQQVRGYPQRAAGEDFYLLNKLRKVGSYDFVQCEPILLSSRRSERVPFGTGPGLKKIDELPCSEDYTFYHPNVFVELKHFLIRLTESYDVQDLDGHFSDELAQAFVQSQKLLPLLKRQQSQSQSVFEKFIHDWFDGLRTLKFIHLARDTRHSSVSFEQLWDSPVLDCPCPGLNLNHIQASTRDAWQRLSAKPNNF